jgi:hypothetical protein
MRLLLIFTVIFGSACSDFDPRSLLNGPRVLGIVADPPEIQIGTPVRLTAVEYNPEPVMRKWSICLVSLGAIADFKCLDESLEFTLENTEQSVDVMIDPGILAAYAAENAGGEMSAECGRECLGRDGQMRTFFDAQVTLATSWEDGSTMKTVKKIRVRLDDEPLNTNPIISNLQADQRSEPTSVEPGAKIELSVRVDLESLQSYTGTDGRVGDEEATLTWYSSAGEFDLPITFGVDHDTTLALPKVLDSDQVHVFVVVRDGRGGTAFESTTIPIE